MKTFSLKSALVMSLFLPLVASAQFFTDTQNGDVNAGFRKTGSHQEAYELVAYLGNVSNYLAMAVGTTTNIGFYTNQLATMCPDGLGNLQWSAFASSTLPLTNSIGAWPEKTCFYTLPRTSASVQTSQPARLSTSIEGQLEGEILGVSSGANALSAILASPGQQGNTNANNNNMLILEPTADAADDDNLSYHIADPTTSSLGDFGGNAIDYSVENVTSNSFTSPVISDFYANVPTGRGNGFTDPITGLSTGNADYLGYFTLATNGALSFTRALAVVAPSVASLSASATNGFGPLTVAFSDSTSGSATNWVWNFGNGVIITNTTAGTVTNIYSAAGSYTVTLTVYGPGGSSSDTVANFIVASPKPDIRLTAAAGKLVFSGSNCPAGAQYRVLSSTNLLSTVATWKPVFTNTFASSGTFSYTNTPGSGNAFFILVSP
jgi:PKD repeat protein